MSCIEAGRNGFIADRAFKFYMILNNSESLYLQSKVKRVNRWKYVGNLATFRFRYAAKSTILF